jgi:hypothetical protein
MVALVVEVVQQILLAFLLPVVLVTLHLYLHLRVTMAAPQIQLDHLGPLVVVAVPVALVEQQQAHLM